LKNAFLREKVYPLVSRISAPLTDFKFSLRGPVSPQNKIVVVEIDGPTLERIGRWPWHRDATAYLVEKTLMAGAKVVGLDMVFSEADPRIPPELMDFLKQKNIDPPLKQFETDPLLQSVIQRYADRLVLGWTSEVLCQPLYEEAQFCQIADPEAIKQFPKDFDKFSVPFKAESRFDPAQTAMISFVTPLTNITLFNDASKHLGFFNAFLDPDGAIRRTMLLVVANGKPYPSLPLEMARIGLHEEIEVTLDVTHHVKRIGFTKSGKLFPVTPIGGMQINFRGPSRVFPHISAADILSEKDQIEDPLNRDLVGKSKSELLKDAYVLIGVSALGVFDMRQFPFESNAPGVG